MWPCNVNIVYNASLINWHEISVIWTYTVSWFMMEIKAKHNANSALWNDQENEIQHLPTLQETWENNLNMKHGTWISFHGKVTKTSTDKPRWVKIKPFTQYTVLDDHYQSLTMKCTLHTAEQKWNKTCSSCNPNLSKVTWYQKKKQIKKFDPALES